MFTFHYLSMAGIDAFFCKIVKENLPRFIITNLPEPTRFHPKSRQLRQGIPSNSSGMYLIPLSHNLLICRGNGRENGKIIYGK